MTRTISLQQCYTEMLTTKIRTRFDHYAPYREQALSLINSGRANTLVADDLDYLASRSKEFSGFLEKVAFTASMLLGGDTLYHSGQFDSVLVSEVRCDSMKLLFVE